MTKTAFLFPGQGAQSVGMGAGLAASLPEARVLFDRAADILGYDLLRLCTEGPAEKLNSTVHSQPALFVCSLAALEQLKRDAAEVVENCAVTAGLSLGEYTALVFAGAMDFDAGLRLVQARGQAMQAAADAVPSGMVSILGMERGQVENLCTLTLEPGALEPGALEPGALEPGALEPGAAEPGAASNEVLQIANLLCPGNIVVSGSSAACQRVIPLAEAAGAMKAIPLAVAGAFHTSLMQPAVQDLTAALAAVEIRTPRIPVVSNVDAKAHQDPAEIRALLVKQVVSPVLWETSMRWLIDDFGVTDCYEIGPGRILRGLLKRIARKLPCENVPA
jgi:[acyl-carrier-protein] S-malonyltransferase